MTVSSTNPDSAESYTVTDVIRRLHEVLDVEVTANQVHLGVHRVGSTPNARGRATAGIPQPQERGGKELRWEASRIEEWLENHPRIRTAEAQQRLRDGAAGTLGGQSRRLVVLRARDEGLSWAQIAHVLSEVEGRPLSRQAVALRYSSPGADK